VSKGLYILFLTFPRRKYCVCVCVWSHSKASASIIPICVGHLSGLDGDPGVKTIPFHCTELSSELGGTILLSGRGTVVTLRN
jgi:hypothetical protein